MSIEKHTIVIDNNSIKKALNSVGLNPSEYLLEDKNEGKNNIQNPFLVKNEDKDIKKGIDTTNNNSIGGNLKYDESVIEKAMSIISSFNDLNTKIEKALNLNSELSKTISSQNKTIKQQQQDIKKAQTKINDFEEKLKTFERTPLVRRSMTNKYIKSEKDGVIKKGDNDLLGDRKVLSISRNKQEISSLLLEKSNIPAMQNGYSGVKVDQKYADAVELLAYNNVISPDIIQDLNKQGIDIVK